MADSTLPVADRGIHLLRDPQLNKPTAFTEAERDALGLTGLLPAGVERPKDLQAFLESQLYKPEYREFSPARARVGRAG
jgi:hypothetical protein